MTARKSRTLSALAVAVVALAGCGSGAHVHLSSIWGAPAGGARPRALLLLIHGGGWAGRSTAGLESVAALGPDFQRLGYETLAFDYRHGALGIEDAEVFYRLARQRVGPHVPICAVGPSAGGHIALMLALRNPDLACVLDFAGPTDLISLGSQPGGGFGYHVALRAFGARQLGAYSPALHAGSIRAKVMLVYAKNDPIVPAAQGEEMAHVLPAAQLIVLPPGPVGFVHSRGGAGTSNGVAVAAYDASIAAEESFLADVARSWRGH
jgi:dienelactone hydrolase